MPISASLLWEKRRGLFEAPSLSSADPIRAETKSLDSYPQKRFLRIRDSLGRIRCFQEGKPVVCGREQEPVPIPRFQEVEEQNFNQQVAPEDQSGQPVQSVPPENAAQQQLPEEPQLTCEDIDEAANVLLYPYDEEELAAERQWQEQFLGWLANQQGNITIDAASSVTRFITGLMNEAADEQWIAQIAGQIQPEGSVGDEQLAQLCGDAKGSALAGLFGTLIGEMAQIIIECVTADLDQQIEQEENAPIDLELKDVLDLHWAELTPEGRKIRLQHAAERRDEIRRRIAEKEPNAHVINTGDDEASVYIHEGKAADVPVEPSGSDRARRLREMAEAEEAKRPKTERITFRGAIPAKWSYSVSSGRSQSQREERNDQKSLGSVYDAGQWLAQRWAELEHTYSRRDAFAMALAMLALQYQFLPGTLYMIVLAAEVARGLQGFARMYFSGWEMQRIALRKDMSWLDPNRGATLVAPAAQASRIGLYRNRRVVTNKTQLVS